ncbi:hypothetical protein EJA03_10890, partial [Vibrio pectenicida]
DSIESFLDYHQRVPTQIDRFILLKSFTNNLLSIVVRDAYNTLPLSRVKIFFIIFALVLPI